MKTSNWQTMDNAPRNRKIIELMKFDLKMPCVYSAWWMPAEKSLHPEGVEGVDGHFWVLNDDDAGPFIEEDEDLSLWFWRYLTLPEGREMTDMKELEIAQ